MQGSISRIVRDRGFGFIQFESGKDVFFHKSGLQNLAFDDLEVGETVEFEMEKTEKGLRASFVRPNGGSHAGSAA